MSQETTYILTESDLLLILSRAISNIHAYITVDYYPDGTVSNINEQELKYWLLNINDIQLIKL